MEKVTGIKSVDFKIKASGHGVVNWNGSTELKTLIDGTWKTVTNHNMPKLRGYTNKKLASNDKGEKFETLKEANEVNFDDTPLYISQNCVRYHLFKDDVINWQHPKIHENVDKVLCSMTGLLRGYVIPKNENKRTSPLLLTDFLEIGKKGNFEQLGRAGSKEKQETKSGKDKSNSLFSKTTFGDTEYIAYGSISIEQLQFISLDKKFDRASMIIKEGEGEKIAERVQEFIKSLDPSKEPKAIFHKNYVRKGTIFNEGEVGILLDNTAIDILVKENLIPLQSTLEELRILTIETKALIDHLNDSPSDLFFKSETIHPAPNETRRP